MSFLEKELILIILQYFDEENLHETMHKLEQETAIFFNISYFEKKVLGGEWQECDKYLSAFTKISDNPQSMKMFFELRKQQYYEALDRHDKIKAIKILTKDLKVFSFYNEQLYRELVELVTLNNIRENSSLSGYGRDVISNRRKLLNELTDLISINPIFIDKLKFPKFKKSHLRHLINQSVNWQHLQCKNQKEDPTITTLLSDHTCPESEREPRTHMSAMFLAQNTANHPSYAVAPIRPNPVTWNANALAPWMMNGNPSSSSQSLVAQAASVMPGPSNLALNVPRHTRPNSAFSWFDFQRKDNDQEMSRLLLRQTVEEVVPAAHTVTPQPDPRLLDELPRVVVWQLHQLSNVTSMDFHPSIHSILAFGNANGEISIWELGIREKLISKSFEIWNLSNCSVEFQAHAANLKESPISVNRVTWSPDASFIGIAFAKHLIQVYSYHAPEPNSLQNHLELDAHDGGVNDIAFSILKNHLCIVTCGDDKLINVWNLDGGKILTFEGHAAPVYSVLCHSKETVQFLFSTSIDGKIRAWVFANKNFQVEYDTPGNGCTKLLYSADGTRLFSCGTSKDGNCFLAEWNESDGAIKKTYSGIETKIPGIVQFDASMNQFLAVGVDHHIKFWDIDSVDVLTSTHTDGGLANLPLLRFNKKGNLLAATTEVGGFKVLANADGIKFLRAVENDVMTGKSNVAIARTMEKNRSSNDASNVWKVKEINRPIPCRTVTMPENIGPDNKAICLQYTKSGNGLLALGSKGVKRMWKWSPNELNPTGKVMTSFDHQCLTPQTGYLLTNDVPKDSDSAIPCLDISKNDSYAIAACGGVVSLFTLGSYKVLLKFMNPPPAATFIVFSPQNNNIVAVGREDSQIHIFNCKYNELMKELKGHKKYITGIVFSPRLNLMVSSDADAQLIFWSMNPWSMKNSMSIQMPIGGNAPPGATKLQFHIDEVKFLICHETHLAIYDAAKMKMIRLWIMPQGELLSTISSATYSSNFQLIYAAFTDGNIRIFDADSLILKCRMASSTYLTASISQNVHPLVVAANPIEPNQFALGLSDGSIKVIEPKESETWV